MPSPLPFFHDILFQCKASGGVEGSNNKNDTYNNSNEICCIAIIRSCVNKALLFMRQNKTSDARTIIPTTTTTTTTMNGLDTPSMVDPAHRPFLRGVVTLVNPAVIIRSYSRGRRALLISLMTCKRLCRVQRSLGRPREEESQDAAIQKRWVEMKRQSKDTAI